MEFRGKSYKSVLASSELTCGVSNAGNPALEFATKNGTIEAERLPSGDTNIVETLPTDQGGTNKIGITHKPNGTILSHNSNSGLDIKINPNGTTDVHDPKAALSLTPENDATRTRTAARGAMHKVNVVEDTMDACNKLARQKLFPAP